MSYRCGHSEWQIQPDKRVSCFQHSYVFMPDTCPNINFLTFDIDRSDCMNMHMLGKLIFGITEEKNNKAKLITVESCTDFCCDNIPGGLLGKGKIFEYGFSVEAYPRILGRENLSREGGLAIRVKTDSGVPFCRIGGGNNICLHLAYPPMASSDFGDNTCTVSVSENKIIITSAEHDLFTVFSFDNKIKCEDGYKEVSASGNELLVIASFAETLERAIELSNTNFISEHEKIQKHYGDIFENWNLKTPDENINKAFDHARLNVEYSWFRPYGWIECPHHWVTMWHMEHTASEEWSGNSDRTKECLRSQMKNLLSGGAIPDMCVNGKGRREWGGNNQFFFREVYHYLEMTGDLDFAVECEPFMDKIIAQTFREYDPTSTGIIGWGTQIGNQEDFESTPGIGSGTGCEGARMLFILSEIKRLVGKSEEGNNFLKASKYSLDRVKKELWLDDVGRFAWYRDSHGEMHIDPAYHGIVYPIIYDQLSDSEKISSIDHLLHRMTGVNGEMYQSNHFGEHAYLGLATWGMQCGSNMQPFAAAAYALLGMNNDAIRPMKFIADIVCGDYQRGSFPETANEKQYAYFSPSAAVFSQGIIESIFGLKLNKLENTFTVSPCFPDDWDHASLRLPNVNIEYSKNGSRHTLKCELNEELDCRFVLRTKPISEFKAYLEGKEIKADIDKHLGWFSVSSELGKRNVYTLEYEYEEISPSIKSVGYASEGDKLEITVVGADVIGIVDNSGSISEFEVSSFDKATVTLKNGLLDDYRRFGWFGLVNFARRMITLRLKVKNIEFDYPAFITVVPRLTVSGDVQNGTAIISISSTFSEEYSGEATLVFGGDTVSEYINLPARGKISISFTLTEKQKNALAYGKNNATVMLGELGYSFDLESKESVFNAVSIPLDEKMLVGREFWNRCTGKIHPYRSHMFVMQSSETLMEGLFESNDRIDIIDSVPLLLNKKGFIPLDSITNRNITVSLDGVRARKLFIVMSSFITNHNIFGEVFRIEVEGKRNEEAYMRPVYIKKLCFPGDIDMACPGETNFGFPTYVPEEPRGLRPILPSESNTSDYSEAMPPEYPQHYLWTDNKTVEVGTAIFNLIEIDLNKSRDLSEMRISVSAAEASGGIFAITVLQ